MSYQYAVRARKSFDLVQSLQPLGLAALIAGSAACGESTSDAISDAGADERHRDAAGAAVTRSPLPEFASELALTTAKDDDADPDVVDVSLTARQAALELRAGAKTKLWTYNGVEPGPLIRAKVGDRVIVRFENALPEATTIHWHGIELPAAMDGAEVSQPPVMPGEGFTYDFVVPHAGLYWYHPHVNSSEQVFRGLYGPLLVENPEDPFYGHEVVLVLDDVLLDADGTLGSPQASGAVGAYFGREGNVVLVNGRIEPTLHVRSGEALRLRVVNTSNSHFFALSVPEHFLYRIGGDSEALSYTEPLHTLLLTPGERADVVLIPTGKPGEVLELRDGTYDRYGCSPDCKSEERVLMRIALDDAIDVPDKPPVVLGSVQPIDVAGVKDELIELAETAASGSPVLTINGQVFSHEHMHAPTLVAGIDTTHVYAIKNTTPHDHPFHLHGFRFQVLDRDGVEPRIREWEDTLNVPGMTSARIAVHFDGRAGDWMFHCHILDHAELGMMGVLRLR